MIQNNDFSANTSLECVYVFVHLSANLESLSDNDTHRGTESPATSSVDLATCPPESGTDIRVVRRQLTFVCSVLQHQVIMCSYNRTT